MPPSVAMPRMKLSNIASNNVWKENFSGKYSGLCQLDLCKDKLNPVVDMLCIYCRIIFLQVKGHGGADVPEPVADLFTDDQQDINRIDPVEIVFLKDDLEASTLQFKQLRDQVMLAPEIPVEFLLRDSQIPAYVVNGNTSHTIFEEELPDPFEDINLA